MTGIYFRNPGHIFLHSLGLKSVYLIFRLLSHPSAPDTLICLAQPPEQSTQRKLSFANDQARIMLNVFNSIRLNTTGEHLISNEQMKRHWNRKTLLHLDNNIFRALRYLGSSLVHQCSWFDSVLHFWTDDPLYRHDYPKLTVLCEGCWL